MSRCGAGNRGVVSWREQAACRGLDPDLFFPGRGELAEPAKQVCAVCPVSAECLDAANDGLEKFGIWSGLSERQRRDLRSPSDGRACARCGERTETTQHTCCGPCGLAADAEARQRAEWARASGRGCPRCGEVLHGGEMARGGLCGRWECDRVARRERLADALGEAS